MNKAIMEMEKERISVKFVDMSEHDNRISARMLYNLEVLFTPVIRKVFTKLQKELKKREHIHYNDRKIIDHCLLDKITDKYITGKYSRIKKVIDLTEWLNEKGYRPMEVEEDGNLIIIKILRYNKKEYSYEE